MYLDPSFRDMNFSALLRDSEWVSLLILGTKKKLRYGTSI